MGKHHNKVKNEKLAAWQNLEGVIWLVGLAILAIKGWWWPGILILAAISIIYETVLSSIFPSTQVEAESSTTDPVTTPQPVEKIATQAPTHPTELLPTNCPRCGAPTRGHEVRWTGSQAADCGFCGANLPLKRS